MCREPFRAKFRLLVCLGYLPNLWQYFWHPFLGLSFKWLFLQNSDQIKGSGKINLSNVFGPKCSVPSPLLESVRYSWDLSTSYLRGFPWVQFISYLSDEAGRMISLLIWCCLPPCIKSINVYAMVRHPQRGEEQNAFQLVPLRKITSFREP